MQRAGSRAADRRRDHDRDSEQLLPRTPLECAGAHAPLPGIESAPRCVVPMTDREAKSRAVKILAKSTYRDLEAQGFDEKQIVAFATELISEVTSKMSKTDKAQQLA
jgi:hypothetical protein